MIFPVGLGTTVTTVTTGGGTTTPVVVVKQITVPLKTRTIKVELKKNG